MSTLKDKRILISGGTTGIGRAIAILLARNGANVLIFGRHKPELEDALEAIGSGATGFVADQAKEKDILKIFEAVDRDLGGLDILVNNAAISGESVDGTDFDKMSYIVQTNLVGYMACCGQAISRMRDGGGGHILNIGSMSAVERDKGSDIYTGTKAGIDGFTDSLRRQVAESGIKVSLIEPGLVGTDMTAEETPPEVQPKKIKAGEMLKAEDIAQCALYILSQPERCDVIHIRIQPRKAAAE